MRPALISLTALAFTATAALAFTVDEIDADGDGALSLAEIQSVHPEVTEDTFVQADTDADGMISAEELAAAQELGLIPADQG